MKMLENITSLGSLTPDTLGLLIRKQEEKFTIPNLTVCICYKHSMECTDHKTRSNPTTFGGSRRAIPARMIQPFNMTPPPRKVIG